jgi:hypothetical protein
VWTGHAALLNDALHMTRSHLGHATFLGRAFHMTFSLRKLVWSDTTLLNMSDDWHVSTKLQLISRISSKSNYSSSSAFFFLENMLISKEVKGSWLSVGTDEILYHQPQYHFATT